MAILSAVQLDAQFVYSLYLTGASKGSMSVPSEREGVSRRIRLQSPLNNSEDFEELEEFLGHVYIDFDDHCVLCCLLNTGYFGIWDPRHDDHFDPGHHWLSRNI